MDFFFFFLITLPFWIDCLRTPNKYLDRFGNDVTKEMLEQKERDRERFRRLLVKLGHVLEVLHLKKKK